ncbi:MAG: hypothetical protein DME19_06215 [Verrucomicrobia bacterium]|nr:MAG: hypothetical protein DME19_06215 [Verrucomicrobiota bacterium]
MKSKQFETLLYSAVGVAAMFVLLAGFNVISAALKQRIDLTREKAYTLSAGTKAILKKIDTPVKIRFYCTRAENATPETVFMRNYAQQVEDLLDEFKQYAGGKLTLQKLNPLPDSDAEDSAKLDGIEGQVVSAKRWLSRFCRRRASGCWNTTSPARSRRSSPRKNLSWAS